MSTNANTNDLGTLAERYVILKQKQTAIESELKEVRHLIAETLGVDLETSEVDQVVKLDDGRAFKISNILVSQQRLDTKALKAERWPIYQMYLNPPTVSARFSIK